MVLYLPSMGASRANSLREAHRFRVWGLGVRIVPINIGDHNRRGTSYMIIVGAFATCQQCGRSSFQG